ncbi:MAG: GNAT family N-acetyltransferase [Bacteroidota bacterium]|nr:GNAT family N-acetyltransferase [Bacteroidota bacterium]MDP4214794.1 GNAT family N-acetyltransferase [Bacteroidota bacterium]MDP4245508.1 GNAT family N-acetyltransferase [Bacteroidota bacterium]MDP4252755.1 GNAT family N-acetyltransferase [Bacteroidota bacterium]MDP4256827.1 GNAT family N-acetyltransferase [Bacteroidota bacterium]
MQDITIRRAIKDDCPRLFELIKELAEFERAPDEVTVGLDHFTDAGFGINPVWWAFVAECDGGVQGFALYYVRYSTWKGRRMYLEDLIVTQKMRGKGMGKLLFDRLLVEAREKNFHGMTWQVLDWNEPAIAFYKKYNAVIESGWMNCAVNFQKPG